MSRANPTFQAVFDAVAVACNCAPSDVAANLPLQSALLARFNRCYQRCYEANEWEDAWTGLPITPSNGLITFAAVADARRFMVFSEDPRPANSAAYVIEVTTSSSGLQVQSDLGSVFVMYLPAAPLFSTTAWATTTPYTVGQRRLQGDEVYRCLIAHTSGTFATDLAALKWVIEPVLKVLEYPAVEMTAGQHDIDTGKYGSGKARQSDALIHLEQLYAAEFQRVQRCLWLRKNP